MVAIGADPAPAPRMQLRLGHTGVLLALIVTAILLAIGGAAGFYVFESRLQARVRETQANATITSWALKDVDATDQSLLALNVGRCESVKALSAWIPTLSSADREKIPNIAGVLNDLQNICPSDVSAYQALAPFLASYVKAIGLRQAADYKGAAVAYQQALSVHGVQPEWRARAFEGLGYAQWKLGNTAAARQALANGAALNVDYVFTQMTQIKVACASHDDAAVVRGMFAAAVKARDGHVAAAASPELRDIAVQDRALLQGDPEIRGLCAYAGVPGRA